VPHALSFICELPYFTDPMLEDKSLSGITRREAMEEGLRHTAATVQILEMHFNALRERLPQNRLFRSVAEYLRRTPKRLLAQRNALATPAYQQEATRAQAFDARVCRSFHCLLYLGELYRLASALGENARALAMRTHIEERMTQIESEGMLQILPLRQLVSLQVGSGLLALQAITDG
jgi:hypothetical protein